MTCTCPVCGEEQKHHAEGVMPGEVFVEGFGIIPCCKAPGAPATMAQRLVRQSREAIDILPNMDPPIAEGVMRAFIDAHQRRPGGLSVEIGTFEGATSRMMLKALDVLYGVVPSTPSAPSAPPFVLTCDPYGGKPYLGGHLLEDKDGLKCVVHDGRVLGYDERAYSRMKKALAPWPNHAHYPVRSFELLPNLHLFWPYPQMEHFVTFILLDGEHNMETIVAEAQIALKIDPQACVVIDNTDTDPRTLPALEAAFKVTKVAESDRPAENGPGRWTDLLVRVEPK